MGGQDVPTWVLVLFALLPVLVWAVRSRTRGKRADELADGAAPTACGRTAERAPGTVVHLVGEVEGPTLRAPLSDREVVWAELCEYRGSQLGEPAITPTVARHPDSVVLRDGSGAVLVWMLHAETRWLPRTAHRERKLVLDVERRLERSIRAGERLTVRGEVLADGAVLAHRCLVADDR